MTIEYQYCTWQHDKQRLMSVRQPVFIEEQNIPESIEIDEHDETCIHLLALDDNKPVGTARLLDDGHIGRICVLKSYRRKGIAAELLNRLIKKAQQQHIKTVLLDAQINVIPFYEKFGFSICSGVFLDAGIEHKTMQLELPQTILGDNNLTIDIDSKALCQETIISLMKQATKSIAIYSQSLETSLYNNSDVSQAIKTLVRRNKNAQVRIICKESQSAARQGHCFINLAQNFSSFVEIRQPCTKEIKQFHQSWLLIDDTGYCHIKNVERFIGIASFNQRLVVKESLSYFNHAWENSEIDQQTRRLSL